MPGKSVCLGLKDLRCWEMSEDEMKHAQYKQVKV